MNMVMMAGHSHSGLEVTSVNQEIEQVFREFSNKVKIMSDDLKRSVGTKDEVSRSMVIAVDLRDAAEQADRDADRAMEDDPELDIFPIT